MSTLRVMTFNIRGAHQKDGVNEWERRANLNVETIQRAAPDLIGFQEFQYKNLEFYQQYLTDYEYSLGPRAFDHDPHEYQAIFWRPSRLTRLADDGFWLSETPEKFGHGWDAACVRVAHFMRFQLADNTIQLTHINTHLDHMGEQARKEGARLILRRLQQFSPEQMPIVLTGDFNCGPGSQAYQQFQGGNFADTHQLNGNKNAYTFHGFGQVRPDTDEGRIDWVLIRDQANLLRPIYCTIIRDAQPPLYPSDHYPVLTEFAIVDEVMLRS